MAKYLAAGMTVVIMAGLWVQSCSKEIKKASYYFNQADSLVQKNKYEEAIAILDEIPANFPKDTAAVCESWRMTADIYAGYLSGFTKAISYYTKIVETYPQSPQAAPSLFKIAFTYETQLNDLPNAKRTYEEFIKKYPTHEMATAAQFSIENLGKSEDDLIDQLPKNLR